MRGGVLSANDERFAKQVRRRHRAAVGISEITDSITIIVSEETGNISVAMRGQLTQYKPEGLQRLLMNKLVVPETKTTLFDPVLKTARSFR